MTIPINEDEFVANHAPRSFADLVFASSRVAEQMRSYANRESWGHVLLHGGYGTGKSSTARLIVEARQRACGFHEPWVEQLHAQDVKDDLAAISNSVNMLFRLYGADTQPFVIVEEVDQLNTAQQCAWR